MRRVVPLLAVCVLALLVVACGNDERATNAGRREGKPVIRTTFYPTTYFTKRLAGDDAIVECPVPSDADPIFFRPDDATILAFQEADLIVVNGAGFEKWVLTTSLPEARVVNTALPFKDRWLVFEKAVEHSHGPSGAHSHVGIDGHTWLDPANARIQVGEIAKALTRLLPSGVAEVEKRREALDADLEALSAAWAAASVDYEGATILASHPAYNYLAKRYGWTIHNLDLDPGVMPDDAAIAAIKAYLAQTPARHVFWESEPLAEIAARFRDELGLESVVVSPCEMLSAGDQAAGQDYFSVMRANVEAARPALRP